MSGGRDGKTAGVQPGAGSPAFRPTPSVGKSPLTAGLVAPAGGGTEERRAPSGSSMLPPDLDPHDELIDLFGVRHLVPLPAGDGMALPSGIRSDLESATGAGLGGVAVHAGQAGAA